VCAFAGAAAECGGVSERGEGSSGRTTHAEHSQAETVD